MTMTAAQTVRYPSDSLEPTTPFSFEAPEGWEVREPPAALVSVQVPDAVDGFHPNVVVASARVLRSVNLRAVIVSSLADVARNGTDLRIESQRVGRFGLRLTYIRGVTLTVGESRVAQLHGVFFAPENPERETVDLFTVVGTCLESHAATYLPVFVKVLASFSFDDM